MRIAMVGATGHVGSYLIPALVRAGHDVVALSRGERRPYHADDAWEQVEQLTVDRDAQDADGTFVATLLETRPDVVIDMICFEPESARQLADGLAGKVGRLLSCGTIWVHGPTLVAPTFEAEPRRPYGEYGVKKAEIERLLLERSARLPCVVLHPGHISGPGWPVINPVGNLDPRVWRLLAAGAELPVPLDGVGTMHHVHAADVSQAFELAISADRAVGEAFHVVSAQATSTRGLAEAAAGWFGEQARLRPVSWPEFEDWAGAEHAAASRDHLQRSHVMSIDKARDLLGYQPAYSSADAVHEAVDWLVANEGLLD